MNFNLMQISYYMRKDKFIRFDRTKWTSLRYFINRIGVSALLLLIKKHLKNSDVFPGTRFIYVRGDADLFARPRERSRHLSNPINC